MTLAAQAPAQASVTLLLDGSSFVRCTGPAALADGRLAAAMQAAATRMAAIPLTVEALTAAADVVVLGVALATTAWAALASDGDYVRLTTVLAVPLAYAALVPARRYALRFAFGLVFRLIAKRPR